MTDGDEPQQVQAMLIKIVVAALFAATWFYVFFIPSGPWAAAAWIIQIPLDALIIGYYVRKRHLARKHSFARRYAR